LVYRVFYDVKKLRVKILHACLLALSLIFSSIGLKAVFDSHNRSVPPLPNLTSLHSWTGLTTVTLFGLQWVGGFVCFLLPGIKDNIRAAYLPR
jgi:cytochrome b-561